MFANTTPAIAADGIRAVINDQLARNAYFTGYYDEPIQVANYRALQGFLDTPDPYLDSVIEARGNTFVLKDHVKTTDTGSLGDLLQLLRGLDDYPLISDTAFNTLETVETLGYLERSYPDLDAEALLQFIHHNGNESPYLEGQGMSVYVPDEERLVDAYRAELKRETIRQTRHALKIMRAAVPRRDAVLSVERRRQYGMTEYSLNVDSAFSSGWLVLLIPEVREFWIRPANRILEPVHIRVSPYNETHAANATELTALAEYLNAHGWTPGLGSAK